jgi:hypothetical protein
MSFLTWAAGHGTSVFSRDVGQAGTYRQDADASPSACRVNLHATHEELQDYSDKSAKQECSTLEIVVATCPTLHRGGIVAVGGNNWKVLKWRTDHIAGMHVVDVIVIGDERVADPSMGMRRGK